MVQCASCGSSELSPIHEVHGIPVHSCLMMDDREAALGYPKGDLVLAFCEACGFVQNNAFDASVHEYSTRYEETQAFSPRFNEFAKSLAERLVETYDLRDKSVLEIGCGKGEWLVLLAEAGAGSGIGIDPGYRPERTTSPAAARLEFIQDFYGPKFAHLKADFIACRHTLEHIPATREFVQLVRDTIGDRTDTVVFFEVPDIARVLEEQAFWDAYYEHCSYFSLGSLARLFRSCGFDPIELWTDYDDQYLMLVARPIAPGATLSAPLAGEDDLGRMRSAVTLYAEQVPKRLSDWKREITEFHAAGKRTALWGSGSKAVSYLTTLGLTNEVGCIVDINPHKHGKFLAGTGHEISAPEALRAFRPDRIVVMNSIYLDEIAADCKKLGVEAELVGI